MIAAAESETGPKNTENQQSQNHAWKWLEMAAVELTTGQTERETKDTNEARRFLCTSDLRGLPSN